MTGWLFDTFVYSGLAIAAVLVLRRPVARHFSAQTAYALWALPLLRLVLPPIVLPARFAPEQAVTVTVSRTAEFVGQQGVAVGAVDWTPLVLGLWLGGAAVFLVWRTVTYRRMRRDVLAGARAVGDVGAIRLVECPAVDAPVAFGVRDKVVALPLLFMAQPDRVGRDLAIAHELEHHRGRDLAANFAAQAVLALHWFNPLAWLGWRAMRHDQEAACDARVLAGRGRHDRARYAALIATFAGAGHGAPSLKGALAAPMACPVLGDASIVHRLRSLTMTEISPRRRWMGRALIGAGALALPLTASVSYAAAEQDAPVGLMAPVPPVAPAAPLAPTPPTPPTVPAGTGERQVERIVIKDEARPHSGQEVRRIVIRQPDGTAHGKGKLGDAREFRYEMRGDPSDPAFAARMAEWEAKMAAWQAQVSAHAGAVRAQAFAFADTARREAPEVVMSCDGDTSRTETTSTSGRKRVVICERRIRGDALASVRRARDTIAREQHLSEATRSEVLSELDGELADLERGDNDD